MIKVFYGENRLAAEKAIKQLLGEDYEIFEGENLTVGDLPSIFQGTSLFETETRRILLKNLTENTEVWAKVGDYLETAHDVIIWEPKIDKRSTGYKFLKDAGVELREFAELKKPELNLVFGIFDLALRDGPRAVQQVAKIEAEQDAFMFVGLLVSQVLKKYEMTRAGARERRILKRLSDLDIQMKSTSADPWLLVKNFLLQVGKIK